MNDYTILRQELRSFFGEEGFVCVNQERLKQSAELNAAMNDFAAQNPQADALDFRQKIYELMRKNIRPVLFPHSPFYFELGSNGGWNGTALGRWELKYLQKSVFQDPDPETWEKYNTRLRNIFYTICGPYFDRIHNNSPAFRVLQTGFKGVYEEALATLPLCTTKREKKWLETVIAGLETIREFSCAFGREAQTRLQNISDEDEKKCMTRIAESAFTVPWEPPRTFYEALNLCSFVRETLPELDGVTINTVGRPDAWLIQYYQDDLKAGRITEEEAYDLICRYLLMGDLIYDKDVEVTPYEGKHENEHTLTLGGCDAQGNEVFNEITEMFLRAYRELNCIYPKPHCRFSAKSNSRYLRLIGDHILSGYGIYSMNNDDCIITALTKTGHSLEDARNYCCTGCWDIVCAACEDNTGSNYFNLANIWDITVNKSDEDLSVTKFHPERIHPDSGFEDIYRTIMNNARSILQEMLVDESTHGKGQADATPAPTYSACCYDCLKNRKDFTEGGMRYNPHAVSLSFFANFVDSFLAFQDLCFTRKVCTVDELLSAVRNNWQGKEDLRQQVLQTSHWGDDRPESTALAQRIVNDFLKMIKGYKNDRGGEYQLAVWIYRELLSWGKRTGATPDGRYAGDVLSQSLNPSHFRNQEALTTVLRNIAKIDLTRFAGNSVTNLCIERENFSSETVEALFRSFAALNLQLLQLNSVSKADMEDAMEHPERHQNLIVRVCGFSAKYIALSPEMQQEILNRRRF